MSFRLTHVGGPTVLIEVGGWRLLTDPTFDAAGQDYKFGWGTGSHKLAGPAIAAADIGPIDAVLLSHDHHDDNLDPAGRALLPTAGAVLTTVAGAKRLGGNARGLEAWATTALEAPGKPTIKVTATPCRHGPPLSRPIVGDVVGFALTLGGPGARRALDLRRHRALRRRAGGLRRLKVGTALLHLGGVRFPISGPLHYTMTAAAGGRAVRARSSPGTVIPIHYEGWKHFRQGREGIEREFAAAPREFRDSVRWLPIGSATDLDA